MEKYRIYIIIPKTYNLGCFIFFIIFRPCTYNLTFFNEFYIYILFLIVIYIAFSFNGKVRSSNSPIIGTHIKVHTDDALCNATWVATTSNTEALLYLATSKMIKLHNYCGNISYLQKPLFPQKKIKRKKRNKDK